MDAKARYEMGKDNMSGYKHESEATELEGFSEDGGPDPNTINYRLAQSL